MIVFKKVTSSVLGGELCKRVGRLWRVVDRIFF